MRSFFASFVLLAVASLPARASEPQSWRYAHPDAKLLMGLNVKGLAASPLSAILAQQFAGGQWSGNGMDILNDIDAVFLSSTAESGAKGKPPLVVVLTGRFDTAKFRKLATAEKATVRRYKGFEVFVAPKSTGEDAQFAIINPQTALIADRASLNAAIDRGQAPAAMPLATQNALFERATAMMAKNEFWLVSVASPKEMMGSKPLPSPLLASIEAFAMGLNFSNGIGLNAGLSTKTDEDARQLATSIQLVMSLAATQKSPLQNSTMADLLRSVQIGAQGTQVQISMNIPKAQLEAAIRDMKNNVQASVGVRGAARSNVPMQNDAKTSAMLKPAEQPAPKPPAPPRKMVIRIEGLDDGPVEIPYKSER